MLKPRPFRFWVWLNTGLWFVCFVGLYFWIAFAFADTNPMSASFCGYTAQAVSDIRTSFLEIYLPYLGLIVSSAVALQRKRNVRSTDMEGLLPVLVLGLSLFFNGGVAKMLFDFILHPPPEYQVVLKDLRIFAATLAFFMAAALSYFFDFGWDNGEDDGKSISAASAKSAPSRSIDS